MLVSTKTLLTTACEGGYAIGAFNVYNLEGARAVVKAAEADQSPAMLQIHPLLSLCLVEASEATVPMAVHLDHSISDKAIQAALDARISSIMADGSHLSYEENVQFTREMTALAHSQGAAVEAELGRISGTEDGLTVPEFEARFTDPEQAAEFVSETRVDALAVCIGNVHGRYHREPDLDFDRLAAIQSAVSVPLVLHGASGLPDEQVIRSIQLGITKFNVNTEVRHAYVQSLKSSLAGQSSPDLLSLMQNGTTAMEAVISSKLTLFGSVGKA